MSSIGMFALHGHGLAPWIASDEERDDPLWSAMVTHRL